MRKFLMVALSLSALALSSMAHAANISNAEYNALSAQNTANRLSARQNNAISLAANVNLWGTPSGIAYMVAHPYDAGDLVRIGANESYAPGWESSFDNPALGGSTNGQ